VWIHPCLDGNGRVARLMSHATLLEALDTGALWSVARGLARSVDLGRLPPKSGSVLEAVLYRGELARGEAAAIVGTGERQARRVVSALVKRGIFLSESSRAPLRLAFPATLAARWLPGLFPEKNG